VLMNDFAAPDPRKKGYPEGHVPLTRFLTLPVIRAGRVVAVVGVGNKAAPYDEEDVAQLRLFTDGLWSVLERQEALAQLNTVSERFHLAVRAGRIGLWDWDLVSGVVHCDTFMETCFALHHHDLATGTPEDWLCRVHGEDRPRVREALETARATGERFEQSFRVQRPDGTLMHLDSLAVTYRGPQDEPLRMVGVVIDVTRQRQAEEALRKSEERFRDLFVDAPLPYQSLDEDGNLLLANTVWLETLGYQREEVLGRNFSEFLHPDWAAHFQQNFPKFKEAGFITGVEFTMLRKDGSTLLASFNGRVSRDSEGRFIRTHCTFQDITERCQAEEALRQAKAEAEAAALAKAQFLANMSHEIRTPLGGVIGAAKLLSQSDLNLDQRQLADMAVESGRALLEIVNDILDFSKIEAGRLDLTPAPFALRADLTSVAAPFRLLAGQRELTLTLTIDPATPDALVGDHGRLDQVLRNLLGNAVKFTETGSVTLAVNHEPACSPAPGMACLRFTVRDTGIGIEPDFLPHIFESFSQADGSYGKRHGGTGLGLAISRSLVERMGGSLEVQSTLGAGSAFTFALCLPLAEHAPLAAETASPYAASRTPQSRPLRVLLAEDNEIGRMLAERILKDAGHTAASVVTGLEVLDRLKQEAFDLVLMDVQMPGLDGISATRSIRQGQAGAHNADIPIVALTAYAQREDREKFLAAGMDDYVPKPVDEDELLAAMRRALELRATRQTAFNHTPGPGRASAAATNDPAGCPRFDRGHLARSYGDRSDLLTEMLTVFQQTSLPEFGRGLRQALAAEDYEHAKRVAHKAIGTFGSVGANRAVQLAHAAETAANTGDLKAFRQFLENLLAEMDELAEHLRLGRPWPDPKPAKTDRGAS